MSFQIIREKLKEKLEGVSSIQEVQDFPSEEFGGFPCAIVKSARNESEFQTTTENKRTYVFTVYLIQEIENKGVRQARRIIESVVDDVIDELDKDQVLTGIDLGNGKDMIIMYPVLTDIVDDTQYVTAELEINIVVQFNINI